MHQGAATAGAITRYLHSFRIEIRPRRAAIFFADSIRPMARSFAREFAGFRRRELTHLVPFPTNVPSRRK